MPSLMADLGTIEPKMNWAVAGVSVLVAVAAVIIVQLIRRPIASTLADSA
jgi:hypothetical protein